MRTTALLLEKQARINAFLGTIPAASKPKKRRPEYEVYHGLDDIKIVVYDGDTGQTINIVVFELIEARKWFLSIKDDVVCIDSCDHEGEHVQLCYKPEVDDELYEYMTDDDFVNYAQRMGILPIIAD